MKVKLLVAPHYFYNAFMPPLGIGIVSAALKKHNIQHDIDDLYVRLYHALRSGMININVFLDHKKVDDFISGINVTEIECETNKIMKLTNFSGYEYVCFSRHFPPLNRIGSEVIIACLIKRIKEKYNPVIIANFGLKNYKEAKLIDFQTSNIDVFIDFLKNKELLAEGEYKRHEYIFLKPDFTNLPLDLYRYNTNTLISEFIHPILPGGRIESIKSACKVRGIYLLPYLFIDGCSNKCIFCEFSGRHGVKVKKYDDIIQDIESLSAEYRTKNFIFLNCNINPTKKIAIEFADRIIKSNVNIRFTDCANFNNLDEEVLTKLKEAGAVRLVFGFESASLKALKYINKVTKLSHALNMLKICYKLGIWAEIDLLIGLPFENSEDIILTLNFIRENYKYIRGVNLNRFILKRASLLYKFSKQYKITNIIPDSNYNYSYDEAGGLKWEIKKKLMEYRYSRFLSCLHPNKVNYLRPCQFIFILNNQFKSISIMNRFLDNIFFAESGNKIDGFIRELKNGDDLKKVM